MQKNEKLQSRRDFMTSAGKIAAGVAAFGVAGSLLTTDHAMAAQEIVAPEYPFEYKKLDPEETLTLGYDAFYEYGGCAAGAFQAIMGQLGEKFGYPYNQINARMYANGAAGYGAASLCGSLGGAIGAVGLLCEPADSKAITAELFKWYSGHEFPVYDPSNYETAKTVSNSVNCAESVSKFMQANDITEMGDEKRLARCAAATAETAQKAVELLNAHYGL